MIINSKNGFLLALLTVSGSAYTMQIARKTPTLASPALVVAARSGAQAARPAVARSLTRPAVSAETPMFARYKSTMPKFSEIPGSSKQAGWNPYIVGAGAFAGAAGAGYVGLSLYDKYKADVKRKEAVQKKMNDFFENLKANKFIRCDDCYLEGADFSNKIIEHGILMFGTNLVGANFENVVIQSSRDVKFGRGTNLENASFRHAKIVFAVFGDNGHGKKTNLRNSNFEEAELGFRDVFNQFNESGVDFISCDLGNSRFNKATLTCSDVDSCDCSNAIFEQALIEDSRVSDSNFTGANLSGVKFENSAFENVNFSFSWDGKKDQVR